jgi:hypothetical protein
MIFGSQSPAWFLGIDALLETFFFLITLLIAWYAWRISRFGGGEQYKRWSEGFLFICVSYVVSVYINFSIYRELLPTYTLSAVEVLELSTLYRVGLFLHMAFFLLGYLLLLLVWLHVEDRRVRWLFAILAVLIAVACVFVQPLFFVALIVFLGTLIAVAYRHGRSASHILVISGFAAILLGQCAYLLLTVWNVAYVVGHFLELLGYGLLAISMLIIMGKK